MRDALYKKTDNHKPEILIRKYYHPLVFQSRLHCKKFPDVIDIILKKQKRTLDIRSCFWDSHKNSNFGSEVITNPEINPYKRAYTIKKIKRF